MVLLVLEVSDLDRSAALYRDGFGIALELAEHGGGDRWTSGRHVSLSWTDGAFLHLALYEAKPGGEVTTAAQVGFTVGDLVAAHDRAVAAGAVVVHEPRAEPWGATSRYRDPDGNVVSLTQAPR